MLAAKDDKEIVFKNPFLVPSLTAALLGEVTGAFTGDMPRALVGETENGLAVMLPLFNGEEKCGTVI